MEPSLIPISLLLLFFLSPCISEFCNPNDQKTLLQIKKSLNKPSSLSSWQPQTDCCAGWDGVECSNATTGNRQGRQVIGVAINYVSDVNADLPPQIGELPSLQKLEFKYFDNLTGTIPYSITKLKNLQSLTIHLTQVSGSVPEFISELKNLEYLDLSSNLFSGPIPKTLSSMPKLCFIDLSANKLTGSLPESFALFSKGNVYLDLAANQLSGTIPQSLSGSNFKHIRLVFNKLRGDASMFFGLNKTTSYLSLTGNKFEFDLTDVKIPKSMINLLLQHNRIYGKIPKGLTELPNYLDLDVSYNRLCGKIPVGGNLQLLPSYAFEHNRCLCGLPLNWRC